VDWTGGLDWWTGPVDWTGGLDWWTDIFCIKNHFQVIVVHHTTMQGIAGK